MWANPTHSEHYDVSFLQFLELFLTEKFDYSSELLIFDILVVGWIEILLFWFDFLLFLFFV